MTQLIDKVRAVQQSAKKPVIMVIGDLMIDHYIWGGATRLSPEAPVPIVNVKHETNTLGGAGNLAQNLVGLGAKVILSGIIGVDAAGKQLSDILTSEGIATSALITDTKRPTTIKTRVLAGTQQLVRIDRELTDRLTDELEADLLQKVTARIADSDIIVFSDYGKGLFSESLSQSIIKAAKDQQKKGNYRSKRFKLR